MKDNIQINMHLNLEDIVDAIRFENSETIFQFIKKLEESKQEFDLLEKCYLHFKEQYEKEKEFEYNK